MYELHSAAIIRLSDNAHIPLAPGNRDYEQYCQWLRAGNTPQVPEVSLDDLKAQQIQAINDWADTEIARMTSKYPVGEVQSWPKQEAEARSLLANAYAYVPLLESIAGKRGISVQEQADRVVSKVETFARYTGSIIGTRQQREDEIKSCQTKEDLQQLVINQPMTTHLA